MSADGPRVRRIWQEGERTLGIAWTDGRTVLYDVVVLRRACPCAFCVEEDTGVRRLRDADVDEAVRPSRVVSVGRYALTVAFTDGHDTGIYPFDALHGRSAAFGGRDAG